MPPFSQHGPVDFLMSVAPPSHYPILTSAPSMDDTLSPSSTQSPSSSPQHPSSSPAPSLDSPSSLAAFLHRLREAASSPTRLLEASKLANVEDDDVKQRYAHHSLTHTYTLTVRLCDTMSCDISKTKNSQLTASD